MGDGEIRIDLAQVVNDHHQDVYRYAYRLTGSIQDAEDLSQQTFLAAQQSLEQLRDPANVRGWLFAVLRNGFRRNFKRRRPTTAVELELNIDSIPAEVPDEDSVDREALQAALSDLPPAYRVVLLMFYFEDCSYREIAEKLDLPIGTVMSRLARAKSAVRARLFEQPSAADGRRKAAANS